MTELHVCITGQTQSLVFWQASGRAGTLRRGLLPNGDRAAEVVRPGLVASSKLLLGRMWSVLAIRFVSQFMRGQGRAPASITLGAMGRRDQARRQLRRRGKQPNLFNRLPHDLCV